MPENSTECSLHRKRHGGLVGGKEVGSESQSVKETVPVPSLCACTLPPPYAALRDHLPQAWPPTPGG